MNIFEKMVENIFSVKEFLEFFTCSKGKVPCIAQSIEEELAYTEFGVDEGISFSLYVKTKDYTPRRGNKIEFRGKEYKIDKFITCPYNLTYTIYLKSVSSK